ncbi:MAG: GNAT family N-acetyltransferase [Actinobacteria bacterium]|nr:GNAT family N-acetyltransferase [Actinomycetota bacterium]
MQTSTRSTIGPSDAEDLAELLDPVARADQYFAVDTRAATLIGFVQYKRPHRASLEIGLGLHPSWTGQGLGESFLEACLDYARRRFDPEQFTLSVARFNGRAITEPPRNPGRFSDRAGLAVCEQDCVYALFQARGGGGQDAAASEPALARREQRGRVARSPALARAERARPAPRRRCGRSCRPRARALSLSARLRARPASPRARAGRARSGRRSSTRSPPGSERHDDRAVPSGRVDRRRPAAPHQLRRSHHQCRAVEVVTLATEIQTGVQH